MTTVKALYEDLKKLMDKGMEDCQLYGVRLPSRCSVNEDNHTKWINVADKENW